MGRDGYVRVRWAVLGTSVVVCLLSYGRAIPLPFGMAAACAIPLIWAVDAYRAQNRLMFALSAALLLITALPLLSLVRGGP